MDWETWAPGMSAVLASTITACALLIQQRMHAGRERTRLTRERGWQVADIRRGELIRVYTQVLDVIEAHAQSVVARIAHEQRATWTWEAGNSDEAASAISRLALLGDWAAAEAATAWYLTIQRLHEAIGEAPDFDEHKVRAAIAEMTTARDVFLLLARTELEIETQT